MIRFLESSLVKKNDFEKLCDEIETCSKREKCKFDPITCAQYYVNQYVDGDRKRLLRIKAEANSISFTDFIVNIFTLTGVAVAVFCLFIDIFTEMTFGIRPGIIFFMIILMIYLCIGHKKFKNVNKWQQYVIVVIEELENKMNQTINH